jgi:hypothetical protein
MEVKIGLCGFHLVEPPWVQRIENDLAEVSNETMTGVFRLP